MILQIHIKISLQQTEQFRSLPKCCFLLFTEPDVMALTGYPL